MTTMLAKVLKHTPHYSMVVTFFWGLIFFSGLESRSKRLNVTCDINIGMRREGEFVLQPKLALLPRGELQATDFIT